MNQTNQYYSNNAQQFFDSTVNVDVEKLYAHFLPAIKNGWKILDAGCGSGRDSKYFQDLGYSVTAFDANDSLAILASKYLGQKVTIATFTSFDAPPSSFDAIWACASLLHVSRGELTNTFKKLSRLLKHKGVFYCSFKYGDVEQIRHGRFFTDMNEATLTQTLNNSGLGIEKTWITADARPGRDTEKWLNAMLIKI